MNNCIPASVYCKKIFDGTHDTPKPVLIGFPLITSKNILGGILNLKDSYNISEVNYTNIQKRSKVSKWDILFSMIGSVGEIYLEKSPNIPYAIKNVGVFSCDDEYKAKWLYYYFKSPQAKQYIQNYLNGAVQKFLPLSTLRSFPVLPYDDKYISCIDLLFALDSKIELNNRINTEIESMAKTLYDYWFVQFDFPDENGKPYKTSGGKMVWNEELKREIPEGWEVVKINSIIEVKDGTHDSPKPQFEGYPLITSKNLNITGLDFENANLISREDYLSIIKRSNVETGDILFSMIGNIGTIYKVEEREISFAIKNVALYKTSQNQDYKNYIYMYLKSIDMGRYMKNVISGSIQKFIGLNSLRETPIISNVTLIKRYNELTIPLFERLEIVKLENQMLVKLRNWLLPMLMNGQVKIN